MNKYAVIHKPDSEYAYPVGENRLRLVLKAGRGERLKEVGILWNNKYDFGKERKYERMRRLCRDGMYDYYVGEVESADVRFAYIFLLTMADGREYYYSEEGVTEEYDYKHGYYTFFQYAYINRGDIVKEPGWVKGAVVYEIFPDRYRRGDSGKDSRYITQEWGALPEADSYAGGDLKGITEELDHIAEMGFTGLYLTPVFKSPSNHKYNVTEYERVDPMFGTNEDLKALIAGAHARGMRVILDAVFNHCDESHAYFRDVKAKGRASKYYNWFIVHGETAKEWSGGCNYEVFADCTYMPKWNTSEVAVREYLTGIALKYLSWGVDGLRLDVADELSHGFLRELRRAVKKEYPEALLIGEVWHENGMYLGGGELDGVMNYKMQKVYRDYFGRGELSAEGAAEQVNRIVMKNRMQTNGMMLNFLDNHDTPRFMRESGESVERMRAALIALYFTAGMPCVMYGTEQGVTGDGDPDCRRTYDWEKEAKEGEFLKDLAKMRAALPAGDFYARTEGGVLVLEREGGEECARAYFGKCGMQGEKIYGYKNITVTKERKWTKKD